MLSDDALVELASEVAGQKSAGYEPGPQVTSLVAAIAATRSEEERHRLAREAQARAEGLGSTLTTLGLQFLRVALFGLPGGM